MIHHIDVFRLVVQVDVTDLEIHSLFEQHEAAAMGERTGGSRIQHHHDEGSLNQKRVGA
jgi:hypothetical protein